MAIVNAAATLAASPQLNAAASVTERASAVLSAAPRLRASGAYVQKGSAHLSAAPVLSISGTATALAAAPTLTATGRVIKTASAALSAAPALTASPATVGLGANARLTAAARVTQLASAHLAAAPALTAFFSSASAALRAAPTLLAPGQAGAAAFTAGARLTVSGQGLKPGAASLAASPVLNAAAATTGRVSAALSAAAKIGWPFADPFIYDEAGGAIDDESGAQISGGNAVSPFVTEVASVALRASPALTAYYSAASAGLRAQLSLTANAAAIRSATALLSAAAHLNATASATERASAALAAGAVLRATAFRIQRASAALSAPGQLAAAGISGRLGSAHLSASAALTAAAQRFASAAAALAAPGHLTATPVISQAVHLNASARLGATATPGRTARASLSAAASLTAIVHGTSPARSALSAAPKLAAVPIDVIVTQAALQASASLAAAAEARFASPSPSRPGGPQPTWQRDVEHFAVAQERQRHAQALWQYGELVMFALLWRPDDIGTGLAQRCTRCYKPTSVIPVTPQLPDYGAAAESQISAAYGQGNQYRCSLCYGTQIIAAQPAGVPGVRALLVRPAILTDTDQNQQRTAKGVVSTGSVSVQATPDFRVHTLDYMFRSDNRRYQLNVPARTTLRTGFGSPWQQAAGITYNLASATLEDAKASVAYIIPPAQDLLAQALGIYTRIPANYAWIEQINGPLIPQEQPPPAASGSYQPPVSFPLPGARPAPPPPAQQGSFLEDEGWQLITDQSGSSII